MKSKAAKKAVRLLNKGVKKSNKKSNADYKPNKSDQSFKLLSNLVSKINDDLYNQLDSSTQDLVIEAAICVNSKKFRRADLMVDIDSFNVPFKCCKNNDEFHVDVFVTNLRTGEKVQAKDVIVVTYELLTNQPIIDE